MAANLGDRYFAVGGGAGGADSACSTPFVSAPSSPARDPSFRAAGFYSAPTSPARDAGDEEYGTELGFDFDFSSRFPSPAAVAMSSADELFHNGQIRPMRLSAFLLRPQALPPLAGEVPTPDRPEPAAPVGADERGVFRSRSVHRRPRSLSPFRGGPHCLSPAANSGDPAAPPSALRSSSSSSSSSSSRHRRWRFLKDLLHRNNSDDGKHHQHHPPPHSPPPPPACKKNPSPVATRGRGRTRSSTHARVYEARRAEAEEMRRRTFLPYRQGLLLGCLGHSSWGMHGLAAAAAAAKPRA